MNPVSSMRMPFVVLMLFFPASGITAATKMLNEQRAARHQELEGETVPSAELAREPDSRRYAFFSSLGGTVNPNTESCPRPATFIPLGSSGLGR